MKLPSHPRVAIVGATGAVGRVMLRILEQRNFPASELVAIASERSSGRQLPYNGESLTVVALKDSALAGVDLVLLDTPDEVARQWGPRAVEAEALVVDNSAAWRMDADVPLVIPEINPQAALDHRGIIASPNCTTIGVAVPLWALHTQFGLKKVIVSSYQATSGAGQPGVDELEEQVEKLGGETAALSSGADPEIFPPTVAFSAPIAFNVIPQVGSLKAHGFTGEEEKMRFESRKIMALPDLQMTATCVRVPTFVGHGSSVYAEFERSVKPEEATAALQFPGVQMTDLPTPLEAAGTDACHVGRVRQDPDNPNALSFFTVMDNLRKGAALNAVQIAELLLPR